MIHSQHEPTQAQALPYSLGPRARGAFQPSLFGEPAHYLPAIGTAHFALFSKPHGRTQHELFPVTAMPAVLRAVDPRWDSYISQATFMRPERRVAALREIGLVYADLDHPGLLEAMRTYGEPFVVQAILLAVDDARLPSPSLIVWSGRGAHVKWLFEDSQPRHVLPRWDALQREIVERLRESLGADPQCVDCTRVLRLVDTCNTKTGDLARVLWTQAVNGEPVRYPFERLADEVFGWKRASHHERAADAAETLRPTRAKRTSTRPVTYHGGVLWWRRLTDIRRLCELRGWTGEAGVPEGYRDQVLFLGSVALSWYAPRKDWWLETKSLARELTPTLRPSEASGYVGSTWRRLQTTVDTGDESRYRFTTARIVRDLAIDAVEQAQLEWLVSPAVSEARNREADRLRDLERRRTAGAEPRAVYVGRAAERAAKARELAAAGLTVRQIAEQLGISKTTAGLALRPTVPSPSACIVAEPRS